MAQRVLRASVSDPMSGFFMVRRELFDRVAHVLSPAGFKILFDLIASQPSPPRIVEFPYEFAERQAGDSKMDGRVVIDYLTLIITKFSRNVISPRAVMFFLVGGSGVFVQLGALYNVNVLVIGFILKQTIAAGVAMTSNFLINNAITYRDRRLKGWAMLRGYLKFCAVCSLPLIANVSVANLVHQHTPYLWIAGLAGAVAGAVWNYVSSARTVW